MANVLLWFGIGLTVVGWIALAIQAAKRMSVKDEMQNFPELRDKMQLRRNYCWFIILVGVVLLLIALAI